jgi:DNA-binding transcriptional LysR family regulator
MELQQLEHFLAVAKNLHFTRTAELLSISQSALSRSIANLEADLGILLIEREGRSVRLNRYGEQFAKGVERVLREIEAAKEELLLAQSPDCGTVALSFLKSLGISAVPKIISQYHAAHPQVQFQLYQESTQVMLDQLERGEVDLVLSSMTETRGTLHWVSLWEERISSQSKRR